VFGFVASYARMAWKVANYNALKREADGLRVRYQSLQQVVSQTNEQLASLQLYAKEVSVAYGIKQKLEGRRIYRPKASWCRRSRKACRITTFCAAPTAGAAQPQFRPAAATGRTAEHVAGAGPLRDRSAGGRTRFRRKARSTRSGHQRSSGTPVHVTADGMVMQAEMVTGGYGRLVVVDTAAASRLTTRTSRASTCMPDRKCGGRPDGRRGSTGRVTAPHLHYEVRVGGTPMNPRRYLSTAAIYQATSRKDFPF